MIKPPLYHQRCDHKICLFLSSLLLVLFTWTGCSPQRYPSLAYADSSFSVSVTGTLCRTSSDGYTGPPAAVGDTYTHVPRHIEATIIVGPKNSEGNSPRAITITFTTPWDGLTIHRTTDENRQPPVTVTYGDTTFTDTEGKWDDMFLVAEALLPTGDISSVSPTSDGQTTITIVAPKIEQQLTFSKASPLPTEVRYTHPQGYLYVTIGAPT